MINQILWSSSCYSPGDAARHASVQRVSEEKIQQKGYRWHGADREGGDHVLFQYTLGGEGLLDFDGQRHRLPPGTGFLVRVLDLRVCYHHPDHAPQPWHHRYLVMIGPLAEALVADWQERNGPTCSIPLDHPFIAELGTWRRHDGRHRPLSTSQGLRIISELFQACERAIEPEAAGGDLAPQAIALMESQLYRNWSVTELAERLGVSREYLTRRFRQETGSTPARFGLKLRLQAAGRCLVSEATPMTDVASAHGFGSVAHFSRAFRACYGLTPGACRRSGNLPTGEASSPHGALQLVPEP